MKKINFENLPSTNTPINATNLNLIQSNVEEVFNGAETMKNIVVDDISCKNLFNINGERNDKYSIISTVSENTLSTKCTGAWSYLEYYNIKVKKGQTYTVSFDFSNTSNNAMGLDIRSATGSSILGSANSTDTSGSKTFTFIADDDVVTMRICSNNTEQISTNTVTYSNIQIEKGNIATEYTSYKKYGYNSMESLGNIVVNDIKCKNYFNMNNLAIPNAVSFENGVIVVNSFANGSGQNLKVLAPDLKAGETYTLSFKTTGSTNYIYLNGSSTNWFNGTAHTITQEELDSYIIVYGNWESSETVYISEIQIEKSLESTEYTTHKEFGYESGSNEYGSWIKYDDGTMNCYGMFSVIGDVINAIGNLFYKDFSNVCPFPVSFEKIESISITPTKNWSIVVGVTPSKTDIDYLTIMTPQAESGKTYYFYYEAIGRWK